MNYDDRDVDVANWHPEPRMSLDNSVALGPPEESAERLSTLQAWDPVGQRQIWSVAVPGASNSGVVATGGGLVFQGLADGRFVAYSAKTGKTVWSYDAGAGISGSPISFSYRNIQYVAVVAGYGGGTAFLGEASAAFGWDYRTQQRRLLVFRLNGKNVLPAGGGPKRAVPLADPWNPDLSEAQIGAKLYFARCSFCHGFNAVAGGSAPDLRASSIPTSAESFAAVVRDGALLQSGMPKFDELTPDDLLLLRSYVRLEANKARASHANDQ
jgi:quinohemoprotein ethanol dehydrogenase